MIKIKILYRFNVPIRITKIVKCGFPKEYLIQKKAF